MGYVTPEQITQAKELDLLTYLQRFDPHELVHVSGNMICSPYGRQGNKERQEGNGETCRSRGSRTTAADKRMSSEADAHTGSSATRWSTSINNREMDQPLQSRGGSRASR